MTVLVIDAGSSSVRVMLFDQQANLIPGALASRAYAFTTTQPGESTMNAEYLQRLIESCIDEILNHPQASSVECVGMATFVGNLLGLADEPVTPIYTYADTQSADDVAALLPHITRPDTDSMHQRTGCPHHTAYQPGRIAWLRRTQPEVFKRVRIWTDFATYLYGQWFGEAACSYSVASWNGLLNRTTLEWDDEWLRVLNLDKSALPKLTDYSAFARGLRPEYARRWPILSKAPFYLAVGDGAAANVGSGCVDETRIALTVGTTSALRAATEHAPDRIPPGLWNYRVDARHHLIGGALTEGGRVYQWARAALRLSDQFEAELLRREPDTHGLTVLPLLSGERSPGWATHASGAIVGLQISTTPLDVLQAMLESVALRLALLADQLVPCLSGDAVVIGGGKALITSSVWPQMIASALNRPIHLLLDEEVTGRGVAILALVAAQKCALTDRPPAVASIVVPHAPHVAALRDARERQERLYQTLIAHRYP